MTKGLRIAGIAAGGWALIVGLWGITQHGSIEGTPGDLQSAVLWIGGGLVALSASSLIALLVGDGERGVGV